MFTCSDKIVTHGMEIQYHVGVKSLLCCLGHGLPLSWHTILLNIAPLGIPLSWTPALWLMPPEIKVEDHEAAVSHMRYTARSMALRVASQ
jgi:hypothetical protein